MKAVIIFLICSVLEFSISVPTENFSSEKTQFEISSQSESKFNMQKLKYNRKTTSLKKKSRAADEKEYIFINSKDGYSYIIESSTYEMISNYFYRPLVHNNMAVVGDTFYKIDTLKGIISSAPVRSMVTKSRLVSIDFKHVGSFPSEEQFIRQGTAVNGSLIYFVTYYGNVYFYDTVSRHTTKIGVIPGGSNYASSVMVHNNLYIYKNRSFYTYNGKEMKSINTTVSRTGAGLFQMSENVCIVGGNETDIYPDPVNCYNTESGNWSTPSYINEARENPGVVSTKSKTYIFGGFARFHSKNMTGFWRNTIEVLNYDTKIWSFAPTSLYGGFEFIEAVVLYS